MGNKNTSNALIFESLDQVKQVVTVSLVQCRCRFIQNKDLYFLFQCLGNFDQLLFSNSQILNFGKRVNIQPDLF